MVIVARPIMEATLPLISYLQLLLSVEVVLFEQVLEMMGALVVVVLLLRLILIIFRVEQEKQGKEVVVVVALVLNH